MQAIDTITGVALPLGMENVDTDLIIPARHLKTITRTGLGKFAFTALRGEPGNIFDQPRYKNAPILIAGANFGCGSSREHAPWALVDMGFKAVIAPSFADIFAGNAFKNGLLLVALQPVEVKRLLSIADEVEITINLPEQSVTTPLGDRFSFDIDPFRKHCLMEGLDEIGLTEQMESDIAAYEARIVRERSWLGARLPEKRS
ncbi:MAG: 3-isopropylmalate dehydratase small subunit [Alphaproteobacteria bacterium]|nr:MAG: 3-isopropylmalate dehydratase small subunit [Alphaproteobacteria bacterium]